MGYKNMVLGVKIDRRVSGKTVHLGFKDKESLNVVVSNLLSCMDGTSILLYSRDKSRTMKWKVNPDGISNYRIIKAVEWLEAEGYVINTIASAYQLYDDMKDMSYCVPTDKFTYKFNIDGIPAVVKEARLSAAQVLKYKGDDGLEIKYRNTQENLAYENAMKLMNRSNSNFDVRDEHGSSVDTIYLRNFRVDTSLNGRMYSPGVMGIENKVAKGRLKMVAGSKRFVECDYNAMHFMILADLHGYSFPQGDTYMNMLPDDMKSKPNRQAIKMCVVIMLNCPSRASALLAFRKPLAEATGHTFISPSHVMDCIQSFAGTLTQHLYTERLGLKLVNIESHIMTDVVQFFVALDRIALPVHDSCLVVEEDAELLSTTMADFYRKHMKVDRVVTMTYSSFADGVLVKQDCSR